MRHVLLLLTLLCGMAAHAAIDVYEFHDAAEEQRFRDLLGELRCPKCQNQSLADSNAGIAKDLKDRTYLLLKEGRSNGEIKTYLIERYGDFITYRPPLRASTLVLWLGPLLLLLLVVVVLVWRVRRSPVEVAPISAEERQRLDALLGKTDDPS